MVTDDEDRENEGDLIMAAELATRAILCSARREKVQRSGIFHPRVQNRQRGHNKKKRACRVLAQGNIVRSVASHAGASAQPAAGPA